MSCGLVVIDEVGVAEMLEHTRPHWEVGDEFMVAGVVDMEAVPEEQRDRPLLEIEPTPIAFFDGFGFEDELSDSRRRRRKSRPRESDGGVDEVRRKRRRELAESDE